MIISTTISNLLRFVKVERGIIKIQISSGKWIPAVDYGVEKNRFSARFLSFVDSQKQVVNLHNYFYENFYVQGQDSLSAVQAPPPTLPDVPDVSLERDVQRFNNAFYKTELTTGQAILVINTSQFIVKGGEWARTGKAIDGLDVVEIFSEKARTNAPEDGNTWLISDGMHHGFNAENQLIRFYFNPFPSFTQQIAHALIKHLDDYGIQFQLKYLRPDLNMDRCDRIVMYLPQRQFIIASWIVLHIYGSFKNYFTQRLPLFVKEIYPGIGFAEEPFTSESFGRSRCLWIASAVQQWSIKLSPCTTESPQVKEIIEEVLAAYKLSELDKMYLNPSSRYPYDFTVFRHKSDFKGHSAEINSHLRTAIEIGNFICREAMWRGPNKFTWISAVADEEDNPCYRPMGKDWERGIVGPLLFLHVLHKYTADPLYKYVVESADTTLDEMLKTETLPSSLSNLYNHVPYNNETKQHTLNDLLIKVLKIQKAKHSRQLAGILRMEKVGTPQQGVFQEILEILHEDQGSDVFNWPRFYGLLDQIRQQPNLFLTNEFGWDDFFPGMNGLSLLGFSYLLAQDPELPQIPLGQLYMES